MAGNADPLTCWRCAAPLTQLSLPLSRMDVCPQCEIDLHVCRQCVDYDRLARRQCRNDDAEDVKEKERRNFCDWFRPGRNAWQGNSSTGLGGGSELDRLFGDGDGGDAADENPLDSLFRDS